MASVIGDDFMLSRWLRWLVVTPVLLFVFGAILLSCGGGSSGGSPTPSTTPGFAIRAIVISTGAPPSPTETMTPTPKNKTVTPTLTPRASATSTNIVSTGPNAVPTGATVSFNAIGTFVKRVKGTKTQTRLVDITTGAATLWT